MKREMNYGLETQNNKKSPIKTNGEWLEHWRINIS